MKSTELALPRRITDIVEEYEQKVANIPQAIAAFESAGAALEMAACVSGTWGQTNIDKGSIMERQLATSLLKSAWLHVFNGLNIKTIASAKDKKRFEQAIENPAPFTLDNIRATFGHFITDPRGNILRGLAEVFCELDQAYKSHDKVKIGVKGLPKRIILSNLSSYGWGKDNLENVLNAIAVYQGKPLVTWTEIDSILKEENALQKERGVRLRRFANGNGHLFFETDTLIDINKALAEYYGEVLADCSEEKPTQKQQSTAVSKDLQYYPTPREVVDRLVEGLGNIEGLKILEPSCGCGRILDALSYAGASVYGIEVDAGRALEARSKGHKVLTKNFLETVPTGDFDAVVMNPPFYGRHYVKHVTHALKFLKPGGILTAILPVTARYDHGELDGKWMDLPVGSFRESGTNINTTVLTLRG